MKLTSEQEVEIWPLRRAGETLRKLGERYGCSHEAIRLYFLGRDPKAKPRKIQPGEAIGKLLVLEELPKDGYGRQFRCLCSCGKERTAKEDDLRTGVTVSCAQGSCRRGENGFQKLITCNGKTQNLAAWAKETGLSHGTIYKRRKAGWSWEQTLNSPPQPGLPYSGAPRGRTRLVTIEGRTKSLCDWALEYGIHPSTVYNRTSQGWSLEAAITQPLWGGRPEE